MNSTSDDSLRGLRVLIPSNRDVYRLVSYGMVIDFENAVGELSDVDVLPVPLPSRRARLAALRQGGLLRPVDPPREAYDICLFVAMDPWWLPALTQVRRLREVAGQIVVYLYDSWLADLSVIRRHRRVWRMVDHLFVSFNHSHEAYAEALDCHVHYLPQAIDERRFHPYREDRPIDVLSLGRRLPAVHEQVRELARREDLFYFFQTAQAPQAIDLVENQELVGRLCQSARAQIHWSVESTNARRAEDGSPVTARWFEAAASGSVVLGKSPENPEFRRLFPYDGFVRNLDPDAPAETERMVLEAVSDSSDREQRVALAEHTRVAHTWKARWREIAETCAK